MNITVTEKVLQLDEFKEDPTCVVMPGDDEYDFDQEEPADIFGQPGDMEDLAASLSQDIIDGLLNFILEVVLFLFKLKW